MTTILGIDATGTVIKEGDPYEEPLITYGPMVMYLGTPVMKYPNFAELPPYPLFHDGKIPGVINELWNLTDPLVMSKPPKVYHTSHSDEWSTPPDFFAAVNGIFKLTMDAAATEANACCDTFLTAEMDALSCDWWGRVWCNPPYSQTKAFISYGIHELMAGHIELAVFLVAARPDTQWWWLAMQYAAEVRFLKGRLKFGGSSNSAPFPSALLIFDKTCTHQSIGWWDWKLDDEPTYAYAEQTQLMQVTEKADLPPEVIKALNGIHELLEKLGMSYAIQGKTVPAPAVPAVPKKPPYDFLQELLHKAPTTLKATTLAAEWWKAQQVQSPLVPKAKAKDALEASQLIKTLYQLGVDGDKLLPLLKEHKISIGLLKMIAEGKTPVPSGLKLGPITPEQSYDEYQGGVVGGGKTSLLELYNTVSGKPEIDLVKVQAYLKKKG